MEKFWIAKTTQKGKLIAIYPSVAECVKENEMINATPYKIRKSIETGKMCNDDYCYYRKIKNVLIEE